MNRGLTRTQVDEIVAASAHVDVPVEQLLDAAAEIRAALLESAEHAPFLVGRPRNGNVAVGSTHRSRRVPALLVAAALTMATLLSAALAGALPAPIQTPVSKVADFFGIDLPAASPEHPGDAPPDSREARGGARNATPVAARSAPTKTSADSPAPQEGSSAADPTNPSRTPNDPEPNPTASAPKGNPNADDEPNRANPNGDDDPNHGNPNGDDDPNHGNPNGDDDPNHGNPNGDDDPNHGNPNGDKLGGIGNGGAGANADGRPEAVPEPGLRG